MTALFRPDIFSEPGPIWEPATDKEQAAIRRLFRRGDVAKAIGMAPAFDEIIERGARDRANSRNYRLWLGVVVKHALDNNVSPGALMFARMHPEVPLLIPSEFVASSGEWSIWPYVPGTTFQGADREFRGLGRSIARLLRALRKEDSPLLPDIAGIDEGCLEWCLTRQDLAPRLARHVHEVRAAMGEMDLTPAVTHIDLHPHNLLFCNGRLVAVMDPDSLRRSPYLTALGYAAYKLVRQRVVWRVERRRAERKDPTFDCYASAQHEAAEFVASGKIDEPFLWLGAKAALLRRIGNIIAADSSPWAMDLERHLVGLGEIDVMRGEA